MTTVARVARGGWDVESASTPIANRARIEQVETNVDAPTTPEMLFDSALELRHESGVALRFEAEDALREWVKLGLPAIEVAAAKTWRRSHVERFGDASIAATRDGLKKDLATEAARRAREEREAREARERTLASEMEALKRDAAAKEAIWAAKTAAAETAAADAETALRAAQATARAEAAESAANAAAEVRLLPIRPRSRGARRPLRTFARHSSPAFPFQRLTGKTFD